MKVSRREFVSTGACAAASFCAMPSHGFAGTESGAKTSARRTLLDLQSNCALHESFAGIRAALGDSHRCVTENELSPNASCAQYASSGAAHVVVVPAAGSVPGRTFMAAAELLEQGATVLWESGAAFLGPCEFTEQRALANRYFGISIQRPLDVWSQRTSLGLASFRRDSADKNPNARKMRAIGHEQIPYVEYSWPATAHVRDFSRVIPLSSPSGRPIAHWKEFPVAWSRPVGAGMLIFLGSPLGPALRAGDSDAYSVFRSMIAV